MKIFLVGGGTGGPVAPLLAVAEALKELAPKPQFFLVGTKTGIEKKIVESSSLSLTYLTIPAGKWRRYFSLLNFTDIFKTLFGFLKSLRLIHKFKPDVIFGAGSFVQVPMAYAGFILKVPVIIHQQDFRLLLSTSLTAPVAAAVTTTFSYTGKNLPEGSGLFAKLPKSKVFTTGNPVREDILSGSGQAAIKLFKLNKDYPTVLVLGGATGAAKLNQVVLASLSELLKYVQIIHVTGARFKPPKVISHPHYHPFDFLGPELKHAYAIADLVISRGGMSTITELIHLGKAAILVPLPQSPQEDNVRLLSLRRSAVAVFEEFLTPELLVDLVRKILWSKELQETLQQNIKRLMPANSATQIAKLLIKFVHEPR